MRHVNKLMLLTAIILSCFNLQQAEAQLLNPCCRPVPVCCGPLVVRRPIIRNAAAELRMAAHYHLNYRYYRGVVYGGPVVTQDHHAVPTPAESHSTEKPYHEASETPSDSVLQPVQPAQPLVPAEPAEPEQPVQPAPADAPASAPEAAPADDDDAFQVEAPTSTTLILTVPENATVTINGKPTTSQGTTRTYISRQVEPNARYRYRVEISWINGSKEYRVSENIDLQPGHPVARVFSTPHIPRVVKK